MDLAQVIILAVIGARLLVPLLIIRWPLPAIVACLIIDAVDQTIFQTVAPDADLSGYQGYDKSLDIYYLVIAYIATLRNWTNGFAVSIARFLLYYRLVGVVLFELTQDPRAAAAVFPNTFEYFFIFYEAVRVRWDPRRMSARLLIGATAFIWIFIKLPQEWWIHVAQLDTTDVVQELIFGVPAGTSWAETFAARPWVVVVAVVVVVLLLVAAWWIITRKLPPADRRWTIDADAEPGRAIHRSVWPRSGRRSRAGSSGASCGEGRAHHARLDHLRAGPRGPRRPGAARVRHRARRRVERGAQHAARASRRLTRLDRAPGAPDRLAERGRGRRGTWLIFSVLGDAPRWRPSASSCSC